MARYINNKDEHDEILNQNSVLFAIMCNFPHFCGEERAKEARDFVAERFKELNAYRQQQPTADVAEVKRGEWKKRIVQEPPDVGDDYYESEYPTCSVCGEYNLSGKSNYCPNCGALNKAEGKE